MDEDRRIGRNWEDVVHLVEPIHRLAVDFLALLDVEFDRTFFIQFVEYIVMGVVARRAPDLEFQDGRCIRQAARTVASDEGLQLVVGLRLAIGAEGVAPKASADTDGAQMFGDGLAVVPLHVLAQLEFDRRIVDAFP